MVKIRLMRVGRRKQPSYRVVVADARSPRDGRIIEAIGLYHPRREPSGIEIDLDRAQYWLDKGAQPSNTVRNLIDLLRSGRAATGDAGTSEPARARATVAASVSAPEEKAAAPEAAAPEASEDEGPDQAPPSPEAAEPPAEVPEAVDQAPAAPDAEPDEAKDTE